MKIKIFRSLIVMLLLSISAKSQTTPCWYDPTWNWQNGTPTNWVAYNVGGSMQLLSPFTNPTNSTDIKSIQDGKDYRVEDGWVLYNRYFGCPGVPVNGEAPYFSLYNRFRGVLRVFVWSPYTQSLQQAKVTISWLNPTSSTAALSDLYHESSQGNDQYPKAMNSEYGFNYVDQFYPFGAWYTTDFTINFDQLTDSTKNYDLQVESKLAISSDVSLSGDFTFTTKSATAKDPANKTTSTNVPGGERWDIEFAKFLGKAPKRSDIASAIAEMDSTVKDVIKDSILSNDISSELGALNNIVQNQQFKDFLLTTADIIGGLNSGLGVLTKVLDHFIGKENPQATNPQEAFVQPTISKGSIKLTGNITTTSNGTQFFSQLPGGNHKDLNDSINFIDLPYYDCPMGIMNLDYVPRILVKKQVYYPMVGTGRPFYGANYGPTFEWTSTQNNNVNDYFWSSKIMDSLVVGLNEASGLEIVEVKAALVNEITTSTTLHPTFVTDIFQDTITYNNFMFQMNFYSPTLPPAAFQSVRNIKYNHPVKSLMKQGIYSLVDLDTVNKHHRYMNQFVALDKFKNTAMVNQPNGKFLIKIQAVLRPKDTVAYTNTPVLFVKTYEVPNSKIVYDTNLDGEVYPFTYEQLAASNYDINLPMPNIIYDNDYLLENVGWIGMTDLNDNTAYIPFKLKINNTQVLPASVNVDLQAQEEIIVGDGTVITPDGNELVSLFINNGALPTSGLNSNYVANHFANCDPCPTCRIVQSSRMAKPSIEQNNESYVSNGIELYPNPCLNRLNIKIDDNSGTSEYFVVLFDINGGKVLSKNVSSDKIRNFTLELGEIVSGVYLVEVRNSKNSLVKREKVIKL